MLICRSVLILAAYTCCELVEALPARLKTNPQIKENMKHLISDYNIKRKGQCELPAASGPCTAHPQWRFYYDPALERCKKFRYGGCGGNWNNFRTLSDCENSCIYDRNGLGADEGMFLGALAGVASSILGPVIAEPVGRLIGNILSPGKSSKQQEPAGKPQPMQNNRQVPYSPPFPYGQPPFPQRSPYTSYFQPPPPYSAYFPRLPLPPQQRTPYTYFQQSTPYRQGLPPPPPYPQHPPTPLSYPQRPLTPPPYPQRPPTSPYPDRLPPPPPYSQRPPTRPYPKHLPPPPPIYPQGPRVPMYPQRPPVPYLKHPQRLYSQRPLPPNSQQPPPPYSQQPPPPYLRQPPPYSRHLRPSYLQRQPHNGQQPPSPGY